MKQKQSPGRDKILLLDVYSKIGLLAVFLLPTGRYYLCILGLDNHVGIFVCSIIILKKNRGDNQMNMYFSDMWSNPNQDKAGTK